MQPFICFFYPFSIIFYKVMASRSERNKCQSHCGNVVEMNQRWAPTIRVQQPRMTNVLLQFVTHQNVWMCECANAKSVDPMIFQLSFGAFFSSPHGIHMYITFQMCCLMLICARWHHIVLLVDWISHASDRPPMTINILHGPWRIEIINYCWPSHLNHCPW